MHLVNTILNQPNCRRVSTARLNRDDSQLVAYLEGEASPVPAGKTLVHSQKQVSEGEGTSVFDCSCYIATLQTKYNNYIPVLILICKQCTEYVCMVITYSRV